ncbi:MAG: transposase [Frankiaceae bacterium]
MWLRWPDGFICPRCGHAGGWAIGHGRYKCTGCGSRTSVTAGTLFDRRRTPLTVWFTACWMFRLGQGRCLGAEPAADAGERLPRHRLGQAAPPAVGRRPPPDATA